MKTNWFIRRGLFYKPIHRIGWLVLLLAMAYGVYTFIDIDGHSHSVSDTLINFLFNFLIIGVIYSVIAFFTSSAE